ncbi:GH36-type glycosyl hydrolase domain-containing protein [Paenibacillus yanchengensis]|uniref:GH36-type glycosyl hydrolase domain-containing protein n=1 Tax=Paenibacillus yanchengensis TaxID=2035833 RepID=A0ABW4YLH3_9BACL
MTYHLEQLRHQARQLALQQQTKSFRKQPQYLHTNIKKHLHSFREAITLLEQQSNICSQSADEWLLDSSEFIEEQAESMDAVLLKRPLSKLPVVTSSVEQMSGKLRIDILCNRYLDLVDGVFDEASFEAFMGAYQEVAVLTIAEIWSLPVMLRAVFLEQIANISTLVSERRHVCTRVDEMLKQLETKQPDSELLQQKLVDAGQSLPLSGPWLVHLVTHLREWSGDQRAVREWLTCQYEHGTDDLNRIITYEHHLQADYQLRARHLITSMRKLERMNWHALFETMTIVAQTLQTTKHDYTMLDTESKHTLLNQIAVLAARFRVPENIIAEQAVQLAGQQQGQQAAQLANQTKVSQAVEEDEKEATKATRREQYVAYYLFDPKGIRKLWQALCKCSKPAPHLRGFFAERNKGTYIAASVIIFGLLTIALTMLLGSFAQLEPVGYVILALLISFPMSEWAVAMVNYSISKLCKPRPLLRLDLSQEIPEAAATLVVIPAIWSSVAEVEQLAGQLEVHFLANRKKNIHFALLGDFVDATEEEMVEDQQIVQMGRQMIQDLNERYHNSGSEFYFLQRKRVWNDSENVYMGWERKRGKLVELVELIKGNTTTSYTNVIGHAATLSTIRYIITLDADTQLPISTAERMIGTMHLPYNRPKLNEKGTRVVEGYGILQPRIGISHPSALRSRLAFLSAEPGIDPYVFAASDPYQDALSEAIFTGKGILDVEVFHHILSVRIPDNRVLSHDLLEGGFLRAGLMSDVELIDDHPSTYVAYQKRLHRWVRGDWQLICWLLPAFRNRRGEVVPIDLSVITKWQILDNLRRSLLSIVYFVLLLLSITLWPAIKWGAIALLIVTWLLPVCRQLPSVWQEKQWRRVNVAFFQMILQIVTLPFHTALIIHAISKTVFRLLVSKKHLLEWTSSSHVETWSKQTKQRLPLQFSFGGYSLIGLFVILAIVQPSVTARWLAIFLAIVWAIAPLLVSKLDQPVVAEPAPLDEPVRTKLSELASDIWKFYEQFAGENDHYLPPDNVQLEPYNGVAHRTSPTNIGFMLTSLIAAHDMKLIRLEQLLDRMKKTWDTVMKLDKWHGHLYNWYDTTDLRVLPPAYVSTVDSGNFVASVMTTKQALIAIYKKQQQWEEVADHHTERQQISYRLKQLSTLIDHMEELIQATDFRQLYDDNAKLFVLGYSGERGEKDIILYDLLASEARQASFVAIALGQISVAHWSQLGRSVKQAAGHTFLLSWTGTMFEYMMPWLIMRTYPNTLWDSTYRAIVGRQIEYGEQQGVPFGISESGYYGFDYALNYQYRAFGVPGLGFKRGLEQDLVIAPYATIMALPYALQKGLQHLEQLEAIGARGEYGFYEAVDYTASRMPRGSEFKIVRSFMAHHQGMAFMTLANLLLPVTMIDYFHADKRVQAAELLLTERIPPLSALMKREITYKSEKPGVKNRQTGPLRQVDVQQLQQPSLHIHSNGTFTTMITATGSGYMQYNGIDLSRWREDAVLDPWGSYLYIRDVSKGDAELAAEQASTETIWSPTLMPCRNEQQSYLTQQYQEKTVFTTEHDGLSSRLEVYVAPEANADIRELTITNNSKQHKVVEITSFVEIALAEHEADKAHPAFSRLFIQTDYDADAEALIASKRARQKTDQPLWAFHKLYVAEHSKNVTTEQHELQQSQKQNPIQTVQFETYRASFLGRGVSLAEPDGLLHPLEGKLGSVADPAFIMRRTIEIPVGKTVQLVAMTGAAASKGEAIDIVYRLSDRQQLARMRALAFTFSQIELAHLNITPEQTVMYQQLATRIRMRSALEPAQQRAIEQLELSQQHLWAHGVSGDRPILLVRANDVIQLQFMQQVITGCVYLWRNGLIFDVVVWNETANGYQQELRDGIHRLLEQYIGGLDHPRGSLRLIDAITAGETIKHLLWSVAHYVLDAAGPSLQAQLLVQEPLQLLDRRLVQQNTSKLQQSFAPSIVKGSRETLQFYNGYGGFSKDGREYVIDVREEHPLPAPWINVLSNEQFGCIVSELFTGYSWFDNSRECKLTPWSNDPALDPAGEMLYIKDEQSGQIWQPSGEGTTVVHGQGYSRFIRLTDHLEQTATVFVPLKDTLKVIRLELKNKGSVAVDLAVTHYAEWVLGVHRESEAAMHHSIYDDASGALIVRNMYQDTFRDAHAFLKVVSDDQHSDANTTSSWTCDRAAFLGVGGSVDQPLSLQSKQLSGETGVLANSCAAYQTKVHIPANATAVVYVLLGCTNGLESTSELAKKYSSSELCEQQYVAVIEHWQQIKSNIQVDTPSTEMNYLLNHWLMYQTIACRLQARTAFYQAGGAYGYRDQLQDSLALLHLEPERTRRQIILHAEHQYEEGDVQHWWHEETNRGIRTKFSDDLLWLPYAVVRYLEQTGDESILDEQASYLHSAPLTAEEHERYEETVRSAEVSSILEHCFRALDISLPVGEHGLPFIGIGDWNDGMSLIGAEGRGESVWLGWFLGNLLQPFSKLAAERGEEKRAADYQQAYDKLVLAMEADGWDGKWYRRAFTDAGTWLGTAENTEGRIDSIAQSWSVISGMASEERAKQAMQSFDEHLVERPLQLARILTPPFNTTEPSPGYIQGYPPGIRENGAQYTHGVIWSIVAWSKLGNGNKAFELFDMLSPINHAKTAEAARTYAGEPYVMAADVYAEPPHEGRAGWTWYTGASGWMYQAGIEAILGIRRREMQLQIDPAIPTDWPRYSVTYRYLTTTYKIEVINEQGKMSGVSQVTLNNKPVELLQQADRKFAVIPLINDGKQHEVVVIM